MTVKEVQELIETWTAKNKIRNNELTNMALLTEEIGKLSRVMVHRFNDRADEPHFRYEVSDEIGDILWTLIEVANQAGVDLTLSLIHALERKSNEALALKTEKKSGGAYEHKGRRTSLDAASFTTENKTESLRNFRCNGSVSFLISDSRLFMIDKSFVIIREMLCRTNFDSRFCVSLHE